MCRCFQCTPLPSVASVLLVVLSAADSASPDLMMVLRPMAEPLRGLMYVWYCSKKLTTALNLSETRMAVNLSS